MRGACPEPSRDFCWTSGGGDQEQGSVWVTKVQTEATEERFVLAHDFEEHCGGVAWLYCICGVSQFTSWLPRKQRHTGNKDWLKVSNHLLPVFSFSSPKVPQFPQRMRPVGEQMFKHMNTFHTQIQAQDRISTVGQRAAGKVLMVPPWAKVVTGADMILKLEVDGG